MFSVIKVYCWLCTEAQNLSFMADLGLPFGIEDVLFFSVLIYIKSGGDLSELSSDLFTSHSSALTSRRSLFVSYIVWLSMVLLKLSLARLYSFTLSFMISFCFLYSIFCSFIFCISSRSLLISAYLCCSLSIWNFSSSFFTWSIRFYLLKSFSFSSLSLSSYAFSSSWIVSNSFFIFCSLYRAIASIIWSFYEALSQFSWVLVVDSVLSFIIIDEQSRGSYSPLRFLTLPVYYCILLIYTLFSLRLLS